MSTDPRLFVRVLLVGGQLSTIFTDADRRDLVKIWRSIDVSAIGRVNRSEFVALVPEAYPDTDLVAVLNLYFESPQMKAKTSVEFWDLVNFALFRLRQAPIAPPPELGAANFGGRPATSAAGLPYADVLHFYMPEASFIALRGVLNFVESHTEQSLQSIGAGAGATAADAITTTSSMQENAVNLLNAVSKDLVHRLMRLQGPATSALVSKAQRDAFDLECSKKRFLPLFLFGGLVMNKAGDVLSRAVTTQSLLAAAGGAASAGLHPALSTLLLNSNVLTRVIPFVLANLMTAVNAGRTFIDEMGKAIVTLLTQIDTLNQSRGEIKELMDANANASGTDEELTAVVESVHPYMDCSRKTFKLSFPANVFMLSIDFDRRSVTCQAEDHIQLYIPTPHSAATAKSDSDLVWNKTFGKFYGPAIDASGAAVPIPGAPAPAAPGTWPVARLLIPGNKLNVEFQSATEYSEKKIGAATRWGFRAVVRGYTETGLVTAGSTPKAPNVGDLLSQLEAQIGSFAALCAGHLITGVEPATDNDAIALFERKHWSLFENRLFRSGLALPYLNREPNEFITVVPRTAGDKFLHELIGDDPHCQTGAHQLVRWMKQRSGMIEPQKCTIENEDGSTAAPGAERIALAGLGNKFRVIARDEFGVRVNTGRSKVSVEVYPGARLQGSCVDWSKGDITITEDVPQCPTRMELTTALLSTDKQFVYLFGGYQQYQSVNSVFKYKISDGSYNRMTQMPQSVRGMSAGHLPAAADGSTGPRIVVGATDNSDLLIYNIERNLWTSKRITQCSHGYGMALWVDPVTAKVHCTGGTNNGSAYTIWDSKKDSFSAGPSMPSSRLLHKMSYDPVSNRLFVLGGTDTANSSPLDTMISLQLPDDPNSLATSLFGNMNKWEVMPSLPMKVTAFGCDSDSNQIVVWGGSSARYEFNQPSYEHIMHYSFANQEWTMQRTKLPKSVRGPSIVMADNVIHAFCGTWNGTPYGFKFTATTTATGTERALLPVPTKKEMAEVVTEPVVTDHLNGTYDLTFSILKSGFYWTEILIDGRPISGSPFRLQVTSPQSPFTPLPLVAAPGLIKGETKDMKDGKSSDVKSPVAAGTGTGSSGGAPVIEQ